MIQSVQIKNFKSIVDIDLKLSQFNVLIGENGGGKSNILEAIAFGAACAGNKLDNEFLESRGIRSNDPTRIKSLFNPKKDIELDFGTDDKRVIEFEIKLINKKWIEIEKERKRNVANLIYRTTFSNNAEEEIERLDMLDEEGKKNFKNLANVFKLFIANKESDETINSFTDDLMQSMAETLVNNIYENEDLSNFIIYAPENTALRSFKEPSQILPLGIRGEGLFNELRNIFSSKNNKEQKQDILDTVSLIDWFEGFNIPNNLHRSEYYINIKDKYLNGDTSYFDQRGANEGFLYLLFYAVLFTSKDTPKMFAIDNVDASFNPKLCTQLVKQLYKLAKKYNKQAIITTHNPLILDGLDLSDENQTLNVVKRNVKGHTIVNKVDKKKGSIKLSDAWVKGYFGGLPNNF